MSNVPPINRLRTYGAEEVPTITFVAAAVPVNTRAIELTVWALTPVALPVPEPTTAAPALNVVIEAPAEVTPLIPVAPIAANTFPAPSIARALIVDVAPNTAFAAVLKALSSVPSSA